MENLSNETWDVVIAGTSLPQALLALSLSRSNLRVLHVDTHNYYGGVDAGLSLEEAERWAETHSGHHSSLSHAQHHRSEPALKKLKSSRAYTLSLRPQIIYASSPFLPMLVTARVHEQLEFLAVGSWWIHKHGKLQGIPGTREDLFADDNLSRRDKMGLMKFLRHVAQKPVEYVSSNVEQDEQTNLDEVLTTRFRLDPSLQQPLAALALTPYPINQTSFGTAVRRIRRHMSSMNYFGPGFAAVYPKYAGLAEIVQVACRAGAVGGATYLLGQGIVSLQEPDNGSNLINLELSDGTSLQANYVIGGNSDIPISSKESTGDSTSTSTTLHSINIVDDPLRHLFPMTADNGVIPAVAIALVDNSPRGAELLQNSPIYLQIHSEDTGECPHGQCIIYASTNIQKSRNDATADAIDVHSARSQLSSAIDRFISDCSRFNLETQPSDTLGVPSGPAAELSKSPSPQILWSMSFASTVRSMVQGADNAIRASTCSYQTSHSDRVIIFPPPTQDVAFDDSVLDDVKGVWREIMTTLCKDNLATFNEDEFMQFVDRNSNED